MITRFALLAMLLAPLQALAQEPPAGPPIPKTHPQLMELSWLVGKWTGKGQLNGAPYTDVAEYKWLLGKQFIRVQTKVKMGDKVVWGDSTTLAWNKKKKQLVWFTFGLDGSLGGGHYTRPDKEKKKNEWLVYGSVGDDPDFTGRTYLRKVDDDTYTVESQTKKTGKWVTFMTSTHKRVKPE